jgi:hypothetical protein
MVIDIPVRQIGWKICCLDVVMKGGNFIIYQGDIKRPDQFFQIFPLPSQGFILQ